MFKAIGLVIGLIAIRVLTPGAFHEAEHALTQFFVLIGDILAHAPTSVGYDATQMTAGYMVQPNISR